jgi:transposase
MSDCLGDISFSSTHAKKRSEKARMTMGADVVTRIVAFALFVLGAKREDIARFVDLPLGTLLSFLTRMSSSGAVALQDRRGPPPSEESSERREKVPRCSVAVEQEQVEVSCPSGGVKIVIPSANVLQCRTVLFTLLTNGLLRAEEVAEAVALSERRVRELAAALGQGDVLALVDKRQGQKKDYRVGPEQKAELIQQLAGRVMTGRSTSGDDLAEAVNERTGSSVSARTIRWHVRKLGLTNINDTLPQLVETLKKTS